jgi:hypothetical protein
VFTRDLFAVVSAAKNLNYYHTLEHNISSIRSIWRVLCCDIYATTNRDKASLYLNDGLASTLACASMWYDLFEGGNVGEEFELVIGTAKHYVKHCAPFCLGRRPKITESTYLGMAPANTEVGDVVFLPYESAIPMVIRRDGEGFRLVGECFLDGIMQGGLIVDDMEFEDIILL